MHTMFALHYAHDYYAGEEDRGGLRFPGDKHPRATGISSTSLSPWERPPRPLTVAVTARRMRRFVLAHTILSFLFNTTVLALAINVGASLL